MGTFPKDSVPEHLHRQVAHLVHHGFFDVNLNVALLQHHRGDAEAVLHILRSLRSQPTEHHPQVSKPAVCLAKIKTGLARLNSGLRRARVTATQWAKGKVAAAQTRKAARVVAWLSCALVLAIAVASGPAMLQASPPQALPPHVCANLAATGIYLRHCPRPEPGHGLACVPLAGVKLSSAQSGGVTVQALQHPPRAPHAHGYYCAKPQPPAQQARQEARLRQAEHELRASHQAHLHTQQVADSALQKQQRAEELVRQLNMELNQAKTELRRLQYVQRTQEQETRRQRHTAKKMEQMEQQASALNKWQRQLEATAKHQAEVERGLAVQGKQAERRAEELVRQLNVELNQAKTELRRLQHVQRTQEQETRQRQRHTAKKMEKMEKQANALNKWQRQLEAAAKHQAEVERGLAVQGKQAERRAEELVRQLNVELNQAKTELRRLQHVQRTQEQETRQRQRHTAKKMEKMEKQANALNKWQRQLEAAAKHQAEVERGLAVQGKQAERRAIELAQTQSQLAKDKKDLAKQHAALHAEREALQRDLAQQEVLSARAHNSRPSSPRVDKVTRDKPASASQYARMGVKELQKMLQRQGCRHCRNLVEKDQLVSAALHMFGMK